MFEGVRINAVFLITQKTIVLHTENIANAMYLL